MSCRGPVAEPHEKAGPTGPPLLLDYVADDPGTDGATALPDREAKALVHGDRLDQLDLHLGVPTGRHELAALGQVDHARDVGGAEVELRAVTGHERRVTAALFLLQAVDLRLELGVRGDRAGLAQHLASLDLLALGTAEQG